MATIRKHRDKWQVQIRRKGLPALARSFIKRADAIQWANQTESLADRSALGTDTKQLRHLTLENILERFRDEVLPARRGHKVERYVINAFMRHAIVKTSLENLRPVHFSAYRDARLSEVTPGTIVRELGLLHHILEVARKDWSIPLTNPIAAIRKPKIDNRRERRLQSGEWERLMQAGTDTRNPLLIPLVRFALATGMRRGEMLASKWGDVNWSESVLRIPFTKNGEPRTIPLSSEALGILMGRQAKNAEGPNIFPMTTEAAKLAWQRLVARAGLADLHFHDLRHEAISRFFERGLSVPEVALISGHKDPRMLFRYTHLRAEDVVRKLG